MDTDVALKEGMVILHLHTQALISMPLLFCTKIVMEMERSVTSDDFILLHMPGCSYLMQYLPW